MTAIVLRTDGVTVGPDVGNYLGKKYSVLSRKETLEAPSSAVLSTLPLVTSTLGTHILILSGLAKELKGGCMWWSAGSNKK